MVSYFYSKCLNIQEGCNRTLGFFVILVSLLGLSRESNAQGTWNNLTHTSPNQSAGVMILMTDGTVLCKNGTGGSNGTGWDKLTPDATGSYKNGTWSTIASMANDRLYFSSQVLRDGRLYVAGGEYGAGGNKGEVYNPVTNTWTACPQIVVQNISDANSELLPNGNVLQAIVDTGGTRLNYIYNVTTNTYAQTGSCLRTNNEAQWVKLPDSSILFIDNYGTTSERYIPASGTWVNDGTVPVSLYDPYGSEAGSAFLLPDGRVFFLGATGNTAYYTPSGTTSPGTWAAGPVIPGALGTPDAPAAMMSNGIILMDANPLPTSANHFPSPSSFFEFNYLTNTFTALSAPGGGSTAAYPTYITNMLDLPDGTVLYAYQGTTQYYQYVPTGSPLAAGQPVVNNISLVSCDTFMITGTNFNGICEGAGYGDDWQNASNYPIVRFLSGTNVSYAKSYNWNRTGVKTGSLPDTAYFAIPSAWAVGNYSMQVVANGNPSAKLPINTTFTISPSHVTVCTGSTSTITPVWSGGTWATGNPSVAVVNASGVVTGTGSGTVLVTYSKVTGCGTLVATATVSVNPTPASVYGTLNECLSASSVTLADSTTGGTWSSGNVSVVTINGSGSLSPVSGGIAIISYTMPNGCFSTAQDTVNPFAGYITGPTSVCLGGSITLASNILGGTWVSSSTAIANISAGGVITTVAPGVATMSYSVTNSCGSAVSSYSITVTPLPTATVTGTTAICSGTSAILSATGTANAVITLSPIGVFTLNGTGTGTVSVSPLATTTYTISSVNNGACTQSGTGSAVVTVNTTPTATITGTKTICNGSVATLSVTGTGSSGITLSSGGTFTLSAAGSGTINVSPAVTTIYTISTVTLGSCSQSGSGSATITVNPIPSATLTGTASVCLGSIGTLSATGTNSAAITLSSSGGSFTLSGTGSGTHTVSPAATTTYSITTVSLNGCSQAGSGGAVITILSLPTVSVSPTSGCPPSTVFTASGSGSSYTWLPASGLSATTGATVTANPAAYKLYTLTTSNGTCSNAITVPFNSAPPGITGGTSIAVGGTTLLSDVATGGIWSSSNTVVATVASGTGSVTGVATGTTVISYSFPSCSTYTITTVTVSSALPSVFLENFNTTEVDSFPFIPANNGFTSAIVVASTHAPDTMTILPTGSAGFIANSTSITMAAQDGAGSGHGFLYWNSWNSLGREDLYTFPFDLSARGSSTDVISFYVWASTDALSEGVKVWMNTSPTITGGTPMLYVPCDYYDNTVTNYLSVGTATISGTTVAAGTTTIVGTSAPSGWKLVSVPMPASFTGTTNYIILDFTSQYGYSDCALDQLNWTIYNNPRIIPTSSSIGLGTVCPGSTSAASVFSITAASLNLPAGSLSVTAPSGFLVATSLAGTYTTSLTVGPFTTGTPSVTGGKLGNTALYVKFSPGTSGTYSGSLSISGGGATASVALSGYSPSTALSISSASSCSGATLTASGTGVFSSYAWSPATGLSAATGVSVVATPSVQTTYTVFATSSSGCGTFTATYTVYPNPVIAFTGATSGCTPITFNASASTVTSGYTLSYLWSPSAGLSSTATAVTIASPSANTNYVVSVTASDGCTGTATVTALASPTISTSAASPVCAGTSLTATGASTYFWSPSTGLSATSGISVFASPIVNTIYTVTGTNTSGCVATGSFTVLALPTATVSGTANICSGSSTILNVTGTPNSFITFSDGTNITLNATGAGNDTVSPSTSFTYLINTVSLSGCSQAGRGSAVVTVNIVPAATITSSGFPICSGSSSSIGAAGTPGALVTWNDGGTITMDYTGHCWYPISPTATVSYSIASVSLSGCTGAGTGSLTVTVNPIPTATITGASPTGSGGPTPPRGIGTPTVAGTTICRGSSANIIVTGTPGASVTLSDGTTGTIDSLGNCTISVSPSVTTTYTITTVSKADCNQAGTGTALINVDPIPTATVTGGATICSGAQAVLTVTGTPAAAITFSDGGNITLDISGNGTYSVYPVATTIYTITSVIKGACAVAGDGGATVNVTPIPNPGIISGSTGVCTGSSTILTDTATGGTWTATNLNATVAAGIVTGVTPGLDTIWFAKTNECGTGTATFTITVNVMPTATVTGSTSVCSGGLAVLTVTGTPYASITLSDGGSLSLNGAGSGNYNENPVTSTTYTISTVNNGACAEAGDGGATVNVTPIPNPGIIVGSTGVCTGNSIILTDTTSGGSWTATNLNATVSGGVVTGVSAGLDTMWYAKTNDCGTGVATFTIAVKVIPTATVTGSTSVCSGGLAVLTVTGTPYAGITLSDGGSFSLDGAGTGNYNENPVTSTTYTISIVNNGACAEAGDGGATVNVTPIPNPGIIIGSPSVCPGSSTLLTDTATGGTWTATNLNATVSGGLVTGVNAGLDTIWFAKSNGCGTGVATFTITVNVMPTATVSGSTSVCSGGLAVLTVTGTAYASVTLSDGGSLSLNGAGIGNYNENPVTSTTYTISTVNNGACAEAGDGGATVNVTPIPNPGIIIGSPSVCPGSSTILTDTAAGGTWTVTNSNATISAGLVTGITAGLDTINYSKGNVCGIGVATFTIAVNVMPTATVTGSTSVCSGGLAVLTVTGTPYASITLSDGGSFSLNGAGIGNYNENPVTSTTYTISTVNNGACAEAGNGGATVNVTPIPNPGIIIGSPGVCLGGSTVFIATGDTGGTWSSSAVGVASVNATGNVFGASPGSAIIAYQVSNACGTYSSTSTVTVNAIPTATISGSTTICHSSEATMVLTGTPLATVFCSDGGSATLDGAGTGVHVTTTPPSVGITTYTITNVSLSGCNGSGTGSDVVTVVNPLSTPTVTGANSICTGSMATYTATGIVGTWTTTSVTIATVSASGVVTALVAGVNTVMCSNANVCGSVSGQKVFTVNTTPATAIITGPSVICTGTTGTFTASVAGGTWTTSATAVASVTPITGIVTGRTVGNAVLSYTIPSSACGSSVVSVYSISVNSTPSAGTLSGATSVCTGATATVSATVGGGTWSMSNANATIVAGTISGVSGGLDTVIYRVSNSCGTASVTRSITITGNPTVGTISFPSTMCVGSTASISCTPAGGTWSVSSSALLAIGAPCHAYSTGVATVYYTVVNSCHSSVSILTVTVITTPTVSAISGNSPVCTGGTLNLTEATAGGTWLSNNPAVATVSGGVVSPLTPGTVTIIYSVTNACGSASVAATVTVTGTPVAAIISGVTSMCTAGNATLTASVAGGAWSSGTPAVATINSVTGAVHAVAIGTDVISYTLAATSCSSALTTNYTVTVISSAAGVLTGATTVCINAATVYTVIGAGDAGTWTTANGNTSVTPTGLTTGMVTGVAAGTSTVVFTVSNACGTNAVNKAITVNPLPTVAPITIGATTLCKGATTPISDANLGGHWTVSDPTILLLGSPLRAGSVAGTAFLNYAITNTCGTTTQSVAVTVTSCPGAARDIEESVTSENNNTNVIKVFPNPSTGMLYIEATLKVDAKLSSIDGRLLINQKDVTELDMNNLANGIYFINVYDNATGLLVKTERVVKN